ncbi:MAG: iron-containing alcohol dehydrogenase [Alphaproteobacteria bacterium]|nr:iron-containing alcohol dehydrogenase [Alphaproteobacteria bacterium]
MPIDLKTLKGNWNYPTRIWFGPGRIAELAQGCASLGIKRPLIVTDPGLAKLPMIAEAVAGAKAAGLGVAVFSDLRPNPVGKNVSYGVAAFKAGKHDGVVAFGGGSALDVGKAVAFMAGQTRPLWDFEDVGDNWARANADTIAPIIAVPTTSGTGSEVGRVSVVTQEETHTKRLIFHPKIQPSLVIADPALTLGLPRHITAATGMDAFAHNLEALCSPMFHPQADGIAVEGIRLVKEWLPVAVKDGSNLTARAYMMAASTMGATAFQKGLGAIHSLSHPVGAVYDTHHGLTNAVFMPYVLVFNRNAIEDKIVSLSRYIGLKDASFTGFLDWVLALRRELSVPHTLKDLGVADDRIDMLAEMATADPSAGTNPIPVGVKEHRTLLEMSFAGRMG